MYTGYVNINIRNSELDQIARGNANTFVWKQREARKGHQANASRKKTYGIINGMYWEKKHSDRMRFEYTIWLFPARMP